MTLLYLTVETRQNTNALLATSRQAALDSDLDFLSDSLQFPMLFERADAPDLSTEDAARFSLMLIRYLRIREFAWAQFRAGVMDELTWQSYMAPTAGVFGSERAKSFLENGEYNGNPEFVAYLKEWLQGNRTAR